MNFSISAFRLSLQRIADFTRRTNIRKENGYGNATGLRTGGQSQ